VRFCSATFFCARKNASHFSLSGAKKRQLPPERYTTCQMEVYCSIPRLMEKAFIYKYGFIRK